MLGCSHRPGGKTACHNTWGTQAETEARACGGLLLPFSAPPSGPCAHHTWPLRGLLCKERQEGPLAAPGEAPPPELGGESAAGVLPGCQARNNCVDDPQPEATHLTSPETGEGLKLGQPSVLLQEPEQQSHWHSLPRLLCVAGHFKEKGLLFLTCAFVSDRGVIVSSKYLGT